MTEYMGIDPIQNIRIQSEPGQKKGYQVRVTDAETGGNIGNITRVAVIIEPGNINQAVITYLGTDDQGKVTRGEDGGPVRKTETLDNPEINTSALVIPDRIVGKALALWDLVKELGERGRPATHSCHFCAFEQDDMGYYVHNSNCIIMRASRLTREE